MSVHYHGLPLTPNAKLATLAGRSFCVSMAAPSQVRTAHEIGEQVVLDSGAFTAWTQGRTVDWDEYAEWVRPWLDYRTTWFVLPDVIDGTEEDQEQLLGWWFNNHRDTFGRGAPVWHTHESLGRLQRLCTGFDRVCIGSSGKYRNVGDEMWTRRMDEAMNRVCGDGPPPCWLHMLRGMNLLDTHPHYPFASTDSSSVSRNHAGNNQGRAPFDPNERAGYWDAKQFASRWVRREQLQLEEAA